MTRERDRPSWSPTQPDDRVSPGYQEALALLALAPDIKAQARLLLDVGKDAPTAAGVLMSLAEFVDVCARRSMPAERWSAWLVTQITPGPRSHQHSDVGQHQALVLLAHTAAARPRAHRLAEVHQLLLVPRVWRAACSRLIDFLLTHRAGVSAETWTALVRTHLNLAAAVNAQSPTIPTPPHVKER